jgi:hypothetical protein
MQIGVQGGGGRLGLVGQGSLLEECRFEESRGWLRTDKEKKAGWLKGSSVEGSRRQENGLFSGMKVRIEFDKARALS